MVREHFGIDLRSTRRGAGAWAVAWLLAGLLAVSLAVGAMVPLVRQFDELAEQVERLDLQQRRQRAGSLPERTASPAERRLRTEAERTAARLHRPWFELLDALEASAQPSVHLLQLSVDTEFSRLQLQVEARSLEAVLQYLRELEAAGPPLRAAQLVNHERTSGESGTSGVQARLSVRLDAGAAHASAANPAADPQALRLACASGPGAKEPCAGSRRP